MTEPVPVRFVPAIEALRCRAIEVRFGGVRARCPHAQTEGSDLCLAHFLAESTNRWKLPRVRVTFDLDGGER